jgi:hypothetical protein
MQIPEAALLATAAWVVFGVSYIAAYARFTHGQTLSGDLMARRLLESRRLREYWLLPLVMLLILAAWPVLLAVDAARAAFDAVSAFRTSRQDTPHD